MHEIQALQATSILVVPMSSDFLVYLRLGFEHISDLKGYDHIAFLIALCAVYSLKQWRNLLWLVTAFTVGHSVTLALSTLNILHVDSDLVEFLIPMTILAASSIDLYEAWASWTSEKTVPFRDAGLDPRHLRSVAWRTKYGLALAFGLIHGLGFSNFLRAVLGAEESIFRPLLAFNVGLEIGQIIILLVVLTIAFAIVTFTRLTSRNWAILLSVSTGVTAISMLISRYSNL